jgi:DNA-directed RNA polymerase specialized sigma24 family protein
MRDKHRAVFILRYVEGMDLGDIATGLGISRASVKRYLAKAVATIQKSVPQEEARAAVHVGTSMLPRLFEAER